MIGASKIVRDISERQRWRRRKPPNRFLGALVESADDAIISKTLDGVVTSWNSAAEKLYGYGAEEMIGKPIAILIPPIIPMKSRTSWSGFAGESALRAMRHDGSKKTGPSIDVSLTISPIKDSLGRIIGASKIARDITEQKRAVVREREALRQAQ